MRISDWSSDVCSSDLRLSRTRGLLRGRRDRNWQRGAGRGPDGGAERARRRRCRREPALYGDGAGWRADRGALPAVELRFLEQGTARTGAGGLEGRAREIARRRPCRIHPVSRGGKISAGGLFADSGDGSPKTPKTLARRSEEHTSEL